MEKASAEVCLIKKMSDMETLQVNFCDIMTKLLPQKVLYSVYVPFVSYINEYTEQVQC